MAPAATRLRAVSPTAAHATAVRARPPEYLRTSNTSPRSVSPGGVASRFLTARYVLRGPRRERQTHGPPSAALKRPSTAPATMVASHPVGRRKPYRGLTRKACSYLKLVGCEWQADSVSGVDHSVPSSLTRDEQLRRRAASAAPFDDAAIVESNVVEPMHLEKSPQRISGEVPDVIVAPAEHERPVGNCEELGVPTLEREVRGRQPKRPAWS